VVERAPRGTRVVGVLALLLGAPVFAELVQSYLPSTGALGETVFLVAFLAPLYGGAALLVREVCLRTGRGWPGRLLLATAFGVLMPTWVDLSLWTPQTAEEIDAWGDALGTSVVGGVSVFALVSWAFGHVLMSLGAPLVVVESLLPAGRGKAWLGTPGMVVVGVLAVLVAVAIHADSVDRAVQASPARYVGSLLVVLALGVAAFSPLGRPVTRVRGRSPGTPLLLGVGGFVLMAVFDLAPVGWPGVTMAGVAVVGGTVLVSRCSRSPSWTARHLAALTFGAILERTVLGFLVPVPPGGDPVGKAVQNVVVLLLVLGLGVLLWRRTRTPAAVPAQ
jgi:hypothetical protein